MQFNFSNTNLKRFLGVVILLALFTLGAVVYRYIINSQGFRGEVNQLEDRNANLSEDIEVRYKNYFALAQAKFDLESYNEALDSLNMIPEETKNRAPVHALYSEIYKGMGDINKAVESIIKATRVTPGNEDYWLTYISYSEDQDSNKDLTQLYEEALKAVPNSLQLNVDYAKYLEKTGQKDKAIEKWSRAIQLDPTNQESYQKEIDRLRI